MASFAMLPSSHLLLPRKPPRLILPIRSSSSSSSSVSSTQFDLKTYWTSLMAQINLKLDEAIPVQYPRQIYEAMRYSVLAKGAKRSPPVMCIATCELFGGNRIAAFPTACALEMVLFFLLSSFSFLFSQHLFILSSYSNFTNQIYP